MPASIERPRARSLVAAATALTVVVAVAGAALAANNSVTGQKKDEFQTAAPTAILIDADNGTVLFEKNADTPTPPSSLAKLMTVEVVSNEIVQGRLKLDDEFIISEDAWRRGGAPSRTSSMFAPIFSKVKVQDLLQRRRSFNPQTMPALRWPRASPLTRPRSQSR